MFKIESYITPILLSYVDKYVRDFHPADSQVSLWSGGVALHNLVLKPEVLQKEFNLPFVLTSGRIHELLIQVPWMKIISEPIVVTINTIECVLTLKEKSESPSTPPPAAPVEEMVETPPSYTQSLIRKIVGNIAIRCHHLILKYVEDDIVVSVNIKYLSMDSAGENWEPMFAEISPIDLVMRKVIKLNDLTLCLDKRNAAGKIETYQEPLLYRCELEFRVLTKFTSITLKRPLYTHMSVIGERLEFSLSCQQLPMMYRLMVFIKALKNREVKVRQQEDEGQRRASDALNPDINLSNQGWTAWAWSFVPTFSGAVSGSDIMNDYSFKRRAPTLITSINITQISILFKVPEIDEYPSLYGGLRKVRQQNVCELVLEELKCQSTVMGVERFTWRAGFKSIKLLSEGACTCGVSDYNDRLGRPTIYMKSTTAESNEPTLPWPLDTEFSRTIPRLENKELLAVSPAFAMEYVHVVNISDSCEDLCSFDGDFEYSNFEERSDISVVFGQIELLICAGLIHRLTTLKAAIDTYDYPPYAKAAKDPKPHELPPVTIEEKEALMSGVPLRYITLYAEKPCIKFAVWDHVSPAKTNFDMDVQQTMPQIGIKSRKLSSAKLDEARNQYFDCIKNMPIMALQPRRLYINLTLPVYPKRLVYATCQYSEPNTYLIENCYRNLNVKFSDMRYFLIYPNKTDTDLQEVESAESEAEEKGHSSNQESSTEKLLPHAYWKKSKGAQTTTMAQFDGKILIKQLELPEYFVNIKEPLESSCTLQIKELLVCTTMAKLLTAYYIVLGSHPIFNQPVMKSPLYTMTLVGDSIEEKDMVYLDTEIDNISFKIFHSSNSHTYIGSIKAVRILALESMAPDVKRLGKNKQAWIFSAPDSESNGTFLKCSLQYCDQLTASSISYFGLWTEGVSISFDPLLCQWLTYSPQPFERPKVTLPPRIRTIPSSNFLLRRLSDDMQSHPTRPMTKTHSSSDKDYVHGTHSHANSSTAQNAEQPAVENKSVGTDVTRSPKWFRDLFGKLRNFSIHCDIGMVTIFFPLETVPAEECPSLYETIENSIKRKDQNYQNKVMVLSLARIDLHSSSAKKVLWQQIRLDRPTTLNDDMRHILSQSFPWKLVFNDLSCYTLTRKSVFSKKSQLKQDMVKTVVLNLVTSVVTISIVTKHKNEKQVIPKPKPTSERRKSAEKSDQATYFAPVVDFKPNSLREFLRGSNRPADNKSPPEKRTDDTRILIEDDTASIDSSTGIVQESPTMQKSNLAENLALEDITHLGLCVHVDTTPLNIGINEDQIFMAVSVLHGLNDVITCLLSRNDTVKSDFYSRTDNTVGSESIHDSIYSTTGHDSYHRSIEELSSKCGMTENYTDASTSEKLKTSPGLTAIFDRKSTGEQQTDSFQDVKVTFWMQWIICHFSINCYAQKDPLASWTPDMKLTFHADDIIASLDVQDDYMKLKLKVSTAVMRHYKRDKKGSWVPGDFFGFIVRGNEKPAKRSEDFGFIGLTLTRANSNSLKSRWHDETLTVGKQKKSDSKTRNITEIVLTLQSLEAILSMTTLENFASTLSPLFLAIDCVQPSTYVPREEAVGATASTSSHPSFNSEKWNSQHYPLCYFDCNNVRVLMPANELVYHDSKQDVLVFEIGAICLTPNAENPICRQPLRPELYEKAARANMLGLPGSDLEDRQYQLLIRDLKVNTGLWFELTKGYSEEATPSLIQENPAVEWNAQKEVSPSCESYKPIINKLDICLVIALAMFHNSNLVCGPSVEFNIVSDVDIYLCTTQLEVITKLMEEGSRLLQKIKQCSGNVAGQRGYESEKWTIICPFSKYFYQPYAPKLNSVVTFKTLTEKSCQVDSPILPTAEKLKHQDSGVDSASSTPPFCKNKLESHSVVIKTMNTAKILREQPEHFDLYMTAGKITVNVYSSIIPMESKGSQNSLKLVDSQPMATSSKDTESVLTHNFTPVVYLQLHQPNVFYSRQNTKCKTQLSIFDIWIGLGDKATESLPAIQDYNITLFETRKGSVDPETGVPPALFTLKINSDTKKKMNLTILVDRPVKFTLCHDRCRRVRDSIDLILKETIHKFSTVELFYTEDLSAESSFKTEKFNSKNAAVWKWKEYFSQFDYIDLNMTQTLISMKTKVQDVIFGLSSLACSIVVASRPDQISCLAVVDSLVLSANSCDGKRKYVLKPFTFGSEVRVCWETWQKTEFSCYHMRPTIYILVDTDMLVLDLRPQNIITFYMLSEEFSRIKNVLNQVYASNVGIRRIRVVEKFESRVSIKDSSSKQSIRDVPSDVLLQEHHYKDDLRIGAFKVVEGGQLPMAYQVIVGTYTMCWRYPHPRAITRILCFPLPFQETISPVCVSCVLEYYCEQTECFEPYTFFELTEDTGVKVDLFTQLPNVVFASTWRVSILGSEKHEEKRPNITFDAKRFMRSEFISRAQKKTQFEDEEEREDFIPITATTLAASLRIDSYFAPNDIARTYCTLRSAGVTMNFYNLVNNEKSLSTAAVKSYIVLSAKMSSWISRAQIYSQDMVLMGLDTKISLDILNVGNLLMVPMVGKFPMRLTSFLRRLCQYDVGYNIDARIGDVAVALGPAHIQNLHILLNQWMHHFQSVKDTVNHSTSYLMPSYDLWFTPTYNEPTCAKSMIKYIIQNSTNMLIRIGQDETDQSIMLDAGVTYDYHWHSVRRKDLFRIATQDGDWCWSRGFGIDYPGLVPVNLDPDSYGCGMKIFVLVENVNSVQRTVTIMGRLVVWNMVNQNFILKIYEKSSDTDTVQRAPMLAAVTAESPSSSIVLNAFNEVMMKVKFANFEAGWSGEIPLKECPRQNVPWLVKVPSSDDMEFVSIWCRVVKSQNHGRLLVILWPLYIINSHLPLDVDMSITTEGRETPLMFPVEGRGKRNHFFCPGTTATKHNLSFQFKNIESKITVNSVPLHYGVTQKSIFDKPMDTDDVDLVVSYLKKWLEKKKDPWPYSCIQSDLPMKWTPIVMQPNTDITVRYLSETPYICSLIVDVAPWGLLANCSSITITLRNTNFSMVCRVKNGMVVSPPSSFVNGPFYLCIESSKKQYVSEPLKVTNNEAGPYQKMPSGVLAVDNHTNTIIFCDDKICPLSLFYEIKHNINVFGVACTYIFTNHLNEDIALAPIAISSETECCIEAICKSFKIIPVNRDNSPIGVPIKKFDLMDTCDDYTNSTPKEFFLYLCLGLHGKTQVEFSCPIRVDQHKHRRCLTLNTGQSSVPVVLTMQEFRGQVFIGLHEDPAPEFLICNNTKLQLFVAQVSNEYLASLEDRMPTTSQVTIIPECEILEWYCKLKDYSSIYYSTPSYCNMYPQIKPKGSVPGDNMSTHLTFCHVPEDQADYRNMIWCPPVNVGMSTSEQFVKLQNQFLDMKVTVKSHLHTSVITMEHVTENDISASDIRKRLSDGSAFCNDTIDDSFTPVPSAKSDNILLDRAHGVSAFMAGRSCSDESDVSELNLLIDDDNTSNERKQELPETISIVDVNSFEPISVMGLTVSNKNKPLTLNLLIDKLEFSMMAEKGSEYSLSGGPVLVLTCDHIMLSVEPSAHHISWVLAIGDVQIDNPRHSDGSFDFPVVLMGQTTSLIQKDRLHKHWAPLWNTFGEEFRKERIRLNSILTVTLVKCKWSDIYGHRSGLSDLTIETAPVLLYIEDKYVSFLLEYAVDLMLPNTPARHSNDDCISTDMIIVPSALILESQAIAVPLRLEKFQISPLNILLSVHTSVRLYIALDHSPLQFDTFERTDMTTSLYHLGHTLTMHYLSGAIFGAGWVVGSLEILGSPSGLVRRVGAGLRDLVLEPWRGLAVGPRALLSGAAAGSASLARQLTQGTVQSVSMVCGSVARNLDLLALDAEHAERATEQRRRRPSGLADALVRGLSGLAVSLLGAVGGIAHHPIVSPTCDNRLGPSAVAAGFTRGLIGAVAKPLSATADLLALAGQGLLSQAGWDVQPQARGMAPLQSTSEDSQDNVRWVFRLSDLEILCTCSAMHDHKNVIVIITDKWFVMVDPSTDKITEMMDLKLCTIKDVQNDGNLEVEFAQVEKPVVDENLSEEIDDMDDYQVNYEAMQRVAKYAGLTDHPVGLNSVQFKLHFSEYHVKFFKSIFEAAKTENMDNGYKILD